MTDINKLPDNTETLKSIIAGLNQELENKNREIEDQNKKIDFYIDENSNLSDLVRLLRRQRFAPKSEVVSSEQLRIFNEAEIAAKEDPEEEEKITRVKATDEVSQNGSHFQILFPVKRLLLIFQRRIEFVLTMEASWKRLVRKYQKSLISYPLK